MPVLIAIVILSAVAGLIVPRATVAYLFAGALAVLANVVFIWAIADGKGDDPAWLLLLSLAGGAMAIGAVRVGVAVRRSITRRRLPSSA